MTVWTARVPNHSLKPLPHPAMGARQRAPMADVRAFLTNEDTLAVNLTKNFAP